MPPDGTHLQLLTGYPVLLHIPLLEPSGVAARGSMPRELLRAACGGEAEEAVAAMKRRSRW